MKTLNGIISETEQHMDDVAFVMHKARMQLEKRANAHDNTKLKKPELLLEFLNNRDQPNAKELEKKWMDYHTGQEDHHIEHFTKIENMNLFQSMEMAFDGAAAAYRRNKGVPTLKSERDYYMKKGIEKQLATVMARTFMWAYSQLNKKRGEK